MAVPAMRELNRNSARFVSVESLSASPRDICQSLRLQLRDEPGADSDGLIAVVSSRYDDVGGLRYYCCANESCVD